MQKSFQNYLKTEKLEQLFNRLGAPDPKILAQNVEHFTQKEGDKRDDIVASYFGQKGTERIVKAITTAILKKQDLPQNAKLLDVGAGSGYFTLRIANNVQTKLPKSSFYAMDPTPAMLLSLANKNTNIVPFLGLAENIEASIREANQYFKIPKKSDTVFSTLMLHHSIEPQKVFQSVNHVLKKNGSAIFLDMCEHSFTEFKTEMGDVHLGFKLETLKKWAKTYFLDVNVKKLPGIHCKSSGRSAEIFVATMQNPR